MQDEQILGRISALVDEEEHLRTRHEESPLSLEERRRVEQIEVALDQCWDLLRQRRARREFGDDPNAAGVRAAETVERYVQ
jgi:Rad3-related DNA helicase